MHYPTMPGTAPTRVGTAGGMVIDLEVENGADATIECREVYRVGHSNW